MNKTRKQPKILKTFILAKSQRFKIEGSQIKFSNNVQRFYECISASSNSESVMVVPIKKNELIFIREYAIGTYSYELGFVKGLIQPGETVSDAANRELKEEVGLGSQKITFLKKMSISSSYFSSRTNVVVAENLYPDCLRGDEPEPITKVYWPLEHALSILEEPDFQEARSIGALFLVHNWWQKNKS